ncbi:MAG TPA: hypothetical protein VFT26_08795, partial [Pyrinomonadaceae bacterium]|nr:hypothetical protein [Pyrinomonadaceae bacterium]
VVISIDGCTDDETAQPLIKTVNNQTTIVGPARWEIMMRDYDRILSILQSRNNVYYLDSGIKKDSECVMLGRVQSMTI